MNETGLVLWDAMCRAIAKCEAVDEVRDIHSKARALEIYWKQARNIEAERQACNVRLRAERRTGELLKELHRTLPQEANSAGANQHSSPATVAGELLSPYAETLAKHDIPERTAERYQQLAEVPIAIFEEALADPENKPSSRRLVEAALNPVQRMRVDSLWLWGRLRDFERDDFGFKDKNPKDVMQAMTPTMQADVRRIAPALRAFLDAMLQKDS